MSLLNIRKKNPLVHCITNTVAANFTANGLLAIGASPIMADEALEAKEMVGIADALLINIGTLHSTTAKTMLIAGKAANEKGIPVVLDPVAVGASDYRQQTVKAILEQVKIDCIRCNIGELADIAGVPWESRGVDSGEGEMDVVETAKLVANTYNTLVFVTGSADVLTDGKETYQVQGGHERITQVTATGCLLSAICAAGLASSEKRLETLQEISSGYKRAAEMASEQQYIGSFQISLLNALERLSLGEKEWTLL